MLILFKYTYDEPVSTYLRNILEHTDFRRLTASHQGVTGSDVTKQRHSIIWLVYSLTQIRPTALAKNLSLLDPLLCSYAATTQESDRLILSILLTCEQYSNQSIAPKAILWGP